MGGLMVSPSGFTVPVQQVDVAFIQESHLRTTDARCSSNKHYYVAASASLDTKTRGSLVVLRRNLSITTLGQFGSEDGKISYIKTIISGCRFAFILAMLPPNMIHSFFLSKHKSYSIFRIFHLSLEQT